MTTTLDVQRHGPVARVFLNRPEVRNAFNDGVIGELTEAFRRLGADAGLRYYIGKFAWRDLTPTVMVAATGQAQPHAVLGLLFRVVARDEFDRTVNHHLLRVHARLSPASARRQIGRHRRTACAQH